MKGGLNYGWNVMEGHDCFHPPTNCSPAGRELPLWEYGHSEGCAVIGGYVYRGRDTPALRGAYIYGDFCTGKIWGLWYDGESVTEQTLLVDSDLTITSFGQDLDRNLYILSSEPNSGIYRLVPAAMPNFSEPATPTPTMAPVGDPIVQGEEIYLNVPTNADPQVLWCYQCHRIEGIPEANGQLRLDLSHIGTGAASRKPSMSAVEYIRESIVDPEAYVPQGVERATPVVMSNAVTAGLMDEQVDALVAFLLTLE